MVIFTSHYGQHFSSLCDILECPKLRSLNCWNFRLGNALVKTSATCSSDLQNLSSTSPCSTASLIIFTMPMWSNKKTKRGSRWSSFIHCGFSCEIKWRVLIGIIEIKWQELTGHGIWYYIFLFEEGKLLRFKGET